MSKNITTIEKSAIEYLCGLIRELSNVSEGIDDINLRSDGTFSSVKIDTLLNNLETNCNEYTDRLVANLSRLELKIVTDEADINKSNILYLHKPNGATSYNQYVVIEGNKVLLGTTDISMTDYYTITQADAKFCLLTDYNSLKTAYEAHKNDTDIHITSAERTKWDKTSTDLTTHTSDTDIHTSADEKASYVKKTDIATTINSSSTDKQVASAKSVYSALSSNLKDTKIMYFDFEGEFNDATLGVNSTNTITEVVRAFANYIINTYGKAQYAILEFITNNNNSAFNQSLPNDKRSCIGTVKYMPWQHTNRVQVILTDLINGDSYIGTLNGSETNDIVWKRVCTTSVADVPLTRIPTNKNTTNYEIVSDNGSSGYIVRDGICAVSLCIKCNSVSAGWIYCFNAMPRPYLSNGVHFSTSNMYNTDAKPIFVKVIGNMLQVRQGSVTSGANSYYISFSYPVAES